MSDSSSSSSGVGVCGLLGVTFVVLKLTDVIGWSWWWVTAPFWMPVTIFVAVMVVGAAFIFIYIRWIVKFSLCTEEP